MLRTMGMTVGGLVVAGIAAVAVWAVLTTDMGNEYGDVGQRRKLADQRRRAYPEPEDPQGWVIGGMRGPG
jgi:hypothetical protein